jgi:SAM-dependent methyltransferase
VVIDAERARAFGRQAERYDRGRPGYPDALFDEILGSAPAGLDVLDVGCGTGIASRQMASRGAHLLGVELNPEMAEIAQRHGVPVEVAAFEDWHPQDRHFDRVTFAQSWHWLDHDASVVKAGELLRPAGRICVFWSTGYPSDELADALGAAYRSVLPEPTPLPVRGYAVNRSTDEWLADWPVIDAIARTGAFDGARLTEFRWSREHSSERWVDQLQSHSDHIVLPPDQLDALLTEVAATIDGMGGSFEMTYRTVLISAVRR